MKILLQHKSSGLYLKRLGEWVSDPGEAMSFPGSTQALRLRQVHHLSDVQLVLKFDQEGTFVPLTIEGQSLRIA